MPVNYATPAAHHLLPVAGIRLGVAEAGIRKKDRRDLCLFVLDPGCTVAGVLPRTVSVRHRCSCASSDWPLAMKSARS